MDGSKLTGAKATRGLGDLGELWPRNERFVLQNETWKTICRLHLHVGILAYLFIALPTCKTIWGHLQSPSDGEGAEAWK